jgi:xanthine dehydrogenase accessory factor
MSHPAQIRVCIKGGGDIASGVAWRLHVCGFRVFITEIQEPLAVRRAVAFCEAVYEGLASVQGVESILVRDPDEVSLAWERLRIPVLVDPTCEARTRLQPHVIVDGTLAKSNLGTAMDQAPLVIALGPGFVAGRDAHYVVETRRGHNLGRLLSTGAADPDTGIPGPVKGFTTERVLRAPEAGVWESERHIGDRVMKGDAIGSVGGTPVTARIDGVIRGLIRPGIRVARGLKIGDIDPRGEQEYCRTISDKALAVAGAVLEGILRSLAAGLE